MQFNQNLCNIMRKKLGYALWLKIACPGQITQQKFVFLLQDLTTGYKSCSVGCIPQKRVSDFKKFVSKNIYASLKLGTEWKD
jgi:hypothetical protein